MEMLAQLRGFGAVLLIAALAEAAWRLGTGRGYDGREAASTVGVAIGHVLAGLVNAMVLAGVFAFVWELAPVRWPLEDWRTWAAGFLAVELAYYLFHRLSHTVRWLWATHAVHHTSRQLTLLAATRLGWTSLLSGGWIIYLPLVLAGFDPKLVIGLLALNLRYQYFLHTEAIRSLGPLEWVLNTPAHHRVHHGRNAPYLDRNFGGVLIVFDRLFGTFARERADEPVRYGLAHTPGAGSPFRLALGEWRALLLDLRGVRSLRQGLRIAFGRP